MHGIINVYKPCGMSSNFVLTLLKRSLNIKKLGHLGTLDPLACGVLPVMVNKGTKLFDYYLSKTKTYRAIFTFGKETDTLDSEGLLVKTSNIIPSVEDINSVLSTFVGKLFQLPPNFSAKKINGKKAYELARNGEEFTLKEKEVEVYNFKLITKINSNSFLFEIHCCSGTYIRSLARDLAYKLNTVAFMSALIRTDSGKFNILNSTYVKELTNINIFDKLIKLDDLLNGVKRVDLPEGYFKQISNGVKVLIDKENEENIVVYCKGKLIGLGKIKDKKLTITTYLLALGGV